MSASKYHRFSIRRHRTKGKDHMQLHCVPVPEARLSQALSLFLEVCSKFKLKFHEIMVCNVLSFFQEKIIGIIVVGSVGRIVCRGYCCAISFSYCEPRIFLYINTKYELDQFF